MHPTFLIECGSASKSFTVGVTLVLLVVTFWGSVTDREMSPRNQSLVVLTACNGQMEGMRIKTC